ncbi:hypothetical protein [Moorena sp. SIO3I6]|nr:hypothetical protein [Moorena sp. SIO3I6]
MIICQACRVGKSGQRLVVSGQRSAVSSQWKAFGHATRTAVSFK